MSLSSALNFIPRTLDSVLNFTNKSLASALNFSEQKVSDYFQPTEDIRFRDVLREGRNILSKPFQPTQEDIDYTKKNRGMTRYGQMLVKNPLSPSGYTYVEPWGTVSMRNVAKEGLDVIGKQMLKNIKGEVPKVFQGLKILSTKLLEKFRGMPEEITKQQFKEVLNKASKEGVKQADKNLIIELANKQISKTNLQNYNSPYFDEIFERKYDTFSPKDININADKLSYPNYTDNLLDDMANEINTAQADWHNKGNITSKKILLQKYRTPLGKQILSDLIEQIPKDENGLVIAYRTGKVGENLPQSFTLSKGMAKTFSHQGTNITPSFLQHNFPNEYSDFGELGTKEVRINPKDIKGYSPYDAEILVDTKNINNQTVKSSKINLTQLANDIEEYFEK